MQRMLAFDSITALFPRLSMNCSICVIPMGDRVRQLCFFSIMMEITQDTYVRRMSAILGSRARNGKQRICINFVEAGRAMHIRQLEQFAEKEVKEMPVRVIEIFEEAAF